EETPGPGHYLVLSGSDLRAVRDPRAPRALAWARQAPPQAHPAGGARHGHRDPRAEKPGTPRPRRDLRRRPRRQLLRAGRDLPPAEAHPAGLPIERVAPILKALPRKPRRRSDRR